ncbi:MAG: hypothetical protein HY051_03260 [Candidatus Aenigmarchaeota archaeon]|nr:hypothetical protein [Candidatus Aenigmarchaeota archaeon]
MRLEKFLLIPVILVILTWGYLFFVDQLVAGRISAVDSGNPQKSGSGEVIGLGTAVSVQVTRQYLFGLLRLPVYAAGIGDISSMHALFFLLLVAVAVLLTVMVIIIERRSLTMVRTQFPGSGSVWVRFGKALGIGALFAFVAFIISGDGSSLPLGLLVAYLEYRQS